MFKSPLFRRVGIYLVLSTAAVALVNRLELEQQSAYQIYIPMFIGIYVISRWLDAKMNQRLNQSPNGMGVGTEGEKEAASTTSRSERGFGD